LVDRFGVPSERFRADSLGGQPAAFLPGNTAPRKVIVLQGLTTAASCSGYQPVEASDTSLEGRGIVTKTSSGWQRPVGGFALRSETVMAAIDAAEMAAQDGTGEIDADDVIQFSYSGMYQDCGNSAELTPTAAHPGSALAAVYAPEDTCLGVVPATEHLKALIARLDQLEPGVQVDLIGHSMGGMVAAYFMSQEPEMARRHVRSVIALDSPLQRFPFVPLCGGYGPAVEDILGRTGVVPAIRSLEGTDLAARVTSIAATDIGSPIPGSPLIEVHCAGSEDKWSQIGNMILGSIGAAIGAQIGGVHDAWKSHSCVWEDEETMGIVAGVVVTG
jgi:hypothetical protein